jgi:beta-glucosidase
LYKGRFAIFAKMTLAFPPHFEFGTSTSAYQIETAFRHDWLGVVARDGYIFDQTTGHEKFWEDDVRIISSLAPFYRMGLMWSKLQQQPHGGLDADAVANYHHLLKSLCNSNVKIMMVLHHFANPVWFADLGGWEKKNNIALWVDYAKKVVDEFGHYVHRWNTFNEPNLYTSMGWVAGEFPPFKKNIIKAKAVIENIAASHDILYDYIKSKFPETTVGISHNCTVFGADVFLGHVPARIMDYCYMEFASSLFSKVDFFGMSYYARIGHDPLPVTYLTTPHKFDKNGKRHDDMWEYYPQGILECIERFWRKFRKPIIITENGICTNDDSQRISAIKDYLTFVHHAIEKGIDVQGYYHWSTWDNFEWSLGPTYQFGLYSHNIETSARHKKPSADVYSKIAHSRTVTF